MIRSKKETVTMASRIRKTLAVAAILAILPWLPAAVAQPYPSKPIKLVVTFPAGGGADFVGRVIAGKLSETLGQPVVVDNRAGAGGMIGNEVIAKSAPDGYSLLLGAAGALTIAPNLYEKVTFDSIKDFEPVALIASSPFVLTLNPSVPANTLNELTAFAKANPGKLNFASSGTGGAPHLAGELYKTMAGVNLVHVPYKGLAPAITDLLGGQVQVLFADVGLVLPHIKAGKLKAVAVTGSQRSAALPEVPTMMEAGLAEYQAGTWYGILAPAATPSAIVARLNAEVRKVLALSDVKSQFAAQGVDPAPSTPEQFATLIRGDLNKWSKLIKEVNIKAE
jgi:tripartite-type tricarboxylate transporter receptor subunit TctC